MKKTTILMIFALICAVSKTQGQVNPKISQLFEELKQTKGVMYPKTPSIIKRGGLDNSGICYSL